MPKTKKKTFDAVKFQRKVRRERSKLYQEDREEYLQKLEEAREEIRKRRKKYQDREGS